jgi:hypothetical protein
MSFLETYKTIAENLLQRPLAEADGFSTDSIEASVAKVGGQLPLALRDYYSVVGKLQFNQSHNRLIEPEQLELAEEAECLAIIDENQSACTWGIKTTELDQEDPTAYCIIPGEEESHSEECSLSEFLVITMYLQCCWGGLEHNGVNKRAKKFMPKIRKSWTKVVDHSGLIIWEHDGMLVSDMEESFVLCAANTEAAFKVLVKEHGFKREKRD